MLAKIQEIREVNIKEVKKNFNHQIDQCFCNAA